MNAREKRLALTAYKIAIEHERERVNRGNGHFRRKSDSAEGMAINWATENEFSGGWDKLNEMLD